VADQREPLLTDLLRQVSRSFYLTLRVLPRPVRSQIGLAYLLARTTDTIADTGILPVEQRLNALAALRERIMGRTGGTLNFGAFAQSQGSPAERTLLVRVEESLALLGKQNDGDAQLIRTVLDIITTGQELDLLRFGAASRERIVALANDADLEDYTYRVAGSVGEFWTRVCCRHLFAPGEVNETQLLADGVRFGRGLQLVNILRDLPRDLREGRCYLPADELRAVGLTPHDLLRPDTLGNLRPVYDRWIAAAHGHLAAGWRYTNTIPRNQRRVRLACAWPILIGARTLALLRAGNPLDPARRLKVTRGEVRGVLFGSLLALGSSRRWERQFAAAVGAGKAVAGPVELP
jgi:farnesyl-diphosphate farnesyltransferase